MDRLLSCLKRPNTLAVILLLFAKTSFAVELRAEAIEAFNKFIASVEMRLEARFSGRTFLWSDEFPVVREQLLKGTVIATYAREWDRSTQGRPGPGLEGRGFHSARQSAGCAVDRAGLQSPQRLL
jgi:hypothetical protein